MSAAAAPKAKKPRAKKDAKPKSHPSYTEMISKAIAGLKERKGSSRQAIAKYLKANYKFDPQEKVDVYVKSSLKSGVKSGKFVHTTGSGASGSFALAKKGEAGAKPKAAGKKRAVAKKGAKSPARKRKAPAAPASAAAGDGDGAAAAPAAAAPAKKARTPKKKAATPKRAKKPAAKKPKSPKAKKPKTPKKAAAKKK